MKRQLVIITTVRGCIHRTAFAIVFAFYTCQAFADGAVRTVALSGQQAPGTPAGTVFSSFGFAGTVFVLNNSGQTAFYASLAGPGITNFNKLGTWTEGRGSGLELLARAGDQAPGFPAGSKIGASTLSKLQINDSGVTAVGEHNPSFWTDNGTSTLQLVAQRRAPIPGIPNAVFYDFPEQSRLNDLGRVTIPGFIDSSLSLFVYDPADGYHGLFQSSANQAPGLPNGVLLDTSFITGSFTGAETNSGRYSIVSRLAGPGVDATNNNAFWISNAGGAPQLVFRSGGAAPGISGNVRLTGTTVTQRVNSLGQFAFYSTMAGDGINSTNNSAIWTGDVTTGPQIAVRSGDQAPGTPAGVMFAGLSFPNPLLFNNRAEIGFAARLSGPEVSAANDTGLWSGTGGNALTLVAREGDVAPGVGANVVFGQLTSSLTDETIALNNFGQFAFIGALSGLGVSTANDRGIWAQDRNGVLRLIVRKGDMLDVDDGPGINLRTIASFAFSDSGLLEQRFQMNDAGQIAFPAIFTDGTQGIFVSSAIAVPEPQAFISISVAAILGAWRRRGECTQCLQQSSYGSSRC